MRTTFPHLITLDASLCSYGGSFFCAMLKKHIAELFSYLPLMYFLFEKDDKSTGNFFSALEDTLKTVKNSENNVITAFKPKESRGWFSFGSKQKVQTYSIAEDVEFIEANNNLLPSNFKPLFFRFVAQKSNFSETNKIIEDLSGQIASESPILKNCLQSLQSVVVAAESSEAPLRDLRREVDFQDNEVKCILGSVVRSSNSLYAIISSIEKFLIDFLHLLRTVSENMPYINGGKKVPKDFPAYEHKSLFIKGGELFKAYALSVKTWEERLEKELGYAEVELNAKKKELCICIFNLLTARANSVNANSF
ncbi:hypothetical protein AGDE_15997 [Angomonas deanei]|uniref:Uncharacterized protein n=1 Tax=Angomonas deanei TaxID=59799 RepID=A0A7G2CJ34_9TRYP|nr:hypothetical protein AGDE_15997 [Angomonas deanei]CAD2219067.1 hypothetical protein, conserved [Angomonas deanei]|eukprot:EPY17973.1 hypothetical protein AGDE_15997 [Angomonas deanei]